MAYTDGNIIIGTSVDVGGVNTGLYKIQKAMKRFQRIAVFAFGGKILAKFGKAALDAASDLQEVQNQVNKAFDEMAWKAEWLASVSADYFGMTELSAKQTAASFMAMGKAMGFSLDEASDLAIKLTELTGDFASFYNMSQDYARVAISAIYTGETETIKRYGIILTEANLQEFAQSKGIDATVKSMGAKDKAILSAMYLLEHMDDVEGDFVDTQKQWANQVRLLEQRWTEFMIAMGDGLISVLTPVVQKLSQLVAVTTQLTKVIWNMLANTFGFEIQHIEEQNAILAETNKDAALGFDEEASAIEDLTKAAKKALAPLDELNIIGQTTQENGGTLNLPTLDWKFDTEEKKDLYSQIKEAVNGFGDLGSYIANSIANSLNSIDWGSVKSKVSLFQQKLGEFLTGLFTSDDTNSMGTMVSEIVKTAVVGALSLSENIDWEELGDTFASNINTFFDNIDAKKIGEAITSWVEGFTTLIKTAFSNIDWLDVLKVVGETLSSISADAWATIIALDLLKLAIKHKVIKAVVAAFSEGFATALGMNSLWEVISSNIQYLGWRVGLAMSRTFKIISAYISNFATKAMVAFGNLSSDITVFIGLLKGGNGLKAAAEMAFGTMGTLIGGIVSLVGGLALAITNVVDMFKNGWSVIKTVLEAVGVALAVVGAILLGVAAWPAVIVGAVVFAVSQIAIIVHDNWDSIVSWWTGTVIPWFQSIPDFFAGIGKAIGDFFVSAWEGMVYFWTDTVVPWWGDVCNGAKIFGETIAGFFKDIWDGLVYFWTDTVVPFWGNVKDGVKMFFSSIVGWFISGINLIIEGLNKLIDALNTIHFELPSWVPGIGGKSFGISIPNIKSIPIPQLAKGAVIPPNKEFMAILGDQKQGTNIEAPLDTIKQALAEVLSQGNNNIHVTVGLEPNSKGLFRIVKQEAVAYSNATGNLPF